MAASITRVVGMSNLCRGDVVNQPEIALAGPSVAVTRMSSKLTERSCATASYSSITRCATTVAL